MPDDTDELVHIALFYRGDAEYLAAVVPFIREGLDHGEPVVVAVPPGKLTLVRNALGQEAEDVVFGDMAEVGRNPARTFPMLAAFSDEHPGRARIVAEPVWSGRPAEAYPACVQNEALFNTAFAGRKLITLCAYDTALSEDVLADARATHPKIRHGATVADSEEFDARDALARCNIPLPVEAGAAAFTVQTVEDLGEVRRFVARNAASSALSSTANRNLQLIATELTTNSLMHAGSECVLSLWQRDGNLICQVDDGGRFTDPLAGRRVPDVFATGGRGLLLVNALADLVRTHTCEAGTAVRAYLTLDRAQGVMA